MAPEWGVEERPRAGKSDQSGGLSRSLGRNGKNSCVCFGDWILQSPLLRGYPDQPAPSY